MLLSVNLLRSDHFANLYDESILYAAKSVGFRVKTVRQNAILDSIESQEFSHLILSGSEASALEDQPWERPLSSLIESWAPTGKPALGICYGHQFLTKVLLGRRHLRRAKEPELGFRRIKIQNHSLFEGINCPVFFCFHQDEVFDLPADVEVLAMTDPFSVQAIQIRSNPIFGVQFHPEFYGCQAEEILEVALASGTEPAVQVWRDPFDSIIQIQNLKVVMNFLNMKPSK